MKTFERLPSTIAAYVLCTVALWQSASLGQEVSIHGRVLERDTSGHIVGTIDGASVELFDQSGNVVQSTKTDEHGFYALRNLVAGEYGYRVATDHERDVMHDQGTLVFALRSGEHVRDFVIATGSQQPKRSTIEVSVVRSTPQGNAPVVHAAVGLSNNLGDKPRLLRTNANGKVEIQAAPGLWTARATADGFEPSENRQVIVRADEPTAIQLVLQGGSDTGSGEPPLEPLENGIHGYVLGTAVNTDQDGKTVAKDLGPIDQAQIEFRTADGVHLGSVETDEHGFYSISSVKPGIVEYKIVAEGFQSEGQKRALHIGDSGESRNVNFTLIAATSESSPSLAKLDVTVSAMHSGQVEPVQNATLILWPTEHDEDKTLVELTAGRMPTPLRLKPGVWKIMARSIELGNSPSSEVTLSDGQTLKHEILFPEVLRDIRALVNVSGAGSESSDAPIVYFLEQSGPTTDAASAQTEKSTPTKVSPLSQEELKAMASDTQSEKWYWAVPLQPLQSGKQYVATGAIEGFPPDNSATHLVEPSGVKVFHLSLLANKAGEFSTLSGGIKLQKEDQQSPLPGAELKLEHRKSGVELPVLADATGKYTTKLKPGEWWGRVVPNAKYPNLGKQDPVRISVPESGSAEMNFLVPAIVENSRSSMVRALVNVEKHSQQRGTPTVVFADSQGKETAASIEPLTANELAAMQLDQATATEGWFWALPTNQLSVGSFRARAELADYREDETELQQVSEYEPKVFHLTLKLKEQLGKLAGYVRNSEDASPIPEANVQIWRRGERTWTNVTNSKGVFGPLSLPAGDYVIAATAAGFQASSAERVSIATGQNTPHHIELSPYYTPLQPSVEALVTVLAQPGCPPQAPKVVFVDQSNPIETWNVTYVKDGSEVKEITSVETIPSGTTPGWLPSALRVETRADVPYTTLLDPNFEFYRGEIARVIPFLEKRQQLPPGSLILLEVHWLAVHSTPYDHGHMKLVISVVKRHGSNVPGTVTKIQSSLTSATYVAQPVQALPPGNFQAVAVAPHCLWQATGMQPVANGKNTSFALTLRHERVAAPVTAYVWEDSPDNRRRVQRIRQLNNTLQATTNDSSGSNVAASKQKVRNEIDTLREFALPIITNETGFGLQAEPAEMVTLWPEARDSESVRIKSKERSQILPGYWWYSVGDETQPSVPQRILVHCDGLEFDIFRPAATTASPTAEAFVVVRCSTEVNQLDPNPSVYLTTLGTPGLARVDDRLDVQMIQSSKTASGFLYWYRTDSLPAGQYQAVAENLTTGARDTTVEAVAKGRVTTFYLSLGNANRLERPGELTVHITRDESFATDPLELPGSTDFSSIHVLAKNMDNEQITRITQDSELGPGWFRSALPAGTWEVFAASIGYQAARSPWPVSLGEADREHVELHLQLEAPSNPPPAEIDVIVRVQAMNSQTQVPEPSVRFSSSDSLNGGQVGLEFPMMATVAVDSPIPDPLANSDHLSVTIETIGTTQLSQRGINVTEYPDSQWFLVRPTSPLPEGTVQVDAELIGYRSDRKTRAIWQGLKTTMVLELIPHLPRLDAIVRNANDGTPVEGIQVRLMKQDGARTQSLRDAYASISDGQGHIELELDRGIGDYVALMSGDKLDKPQQALLQLVPGVNEKHLDVFLNGEMRSATLFGQVVVSEMVQIEKEVDGKIILAIESREKSVGGANVQLRAQGGQSLSSSVATEMDSTNDGFEFRGLTEGEYRVTAEYSGWRCEPVTVQVKYDGTANRTGPVKLTLVPCDAEFEGLLASLLREGWESYQAARSYYQRASQQRPEDHRADLAFALAALRHGQIDAARLALEKIRDGHSSDSLVVQAAEALWFAELNTTRPQSVNSALQHIQQFAAARFAENPASPESREASRLIGVGIGMLQGPWKTMSLATDKASFAASMTSSLNAPHVAALNSGRAQVLDHYRDLQQELSVAIAEDDRRMQSDAQDEQRRKEEYIANLERERDELQAQIDNKRAESEQICAAVLREVTPLQQQLMAGQQLLLQKQLLLQQLQNELRNMPVIIHQGIDGGMGDGGMGGVGAGGMQGGFGNGGNGFGGGGGGGGGFRVEDDTRRTEHWVPTKGESSSTVPKGILPQMQTFDLETQRQNLQRQIAVLNLEIANLAGEIQQLNARILQIQARCGQAQREYNLLLRGTRLHMARIQRDLDKIREAGAKPATPTKSRQIESLEKQLQELETYYQYPLEARRRQLLDGLGCGVDGTSGARTF
ncbi:MAG: carboxypeptidase regulatory-like domain-containing protein [Planctomycetales bacterium]|nr:carboxypeptidase regulatory-like domain-containing protein [Planctomycetales bacterium]